MNDRVFVYGSLRKDSPNHFLLDGAALLGEYRTEPLFTMYDLGHFPGVIARGVSEISGDVFAIDEVLLARLDQLQEYPDLFGRTRIATPYGDAWIYLLGPERPDAGVVAGGDWAAYRARYKLSVAG